MKLDNLASLLFLALIAIVCVAVIMPARGHIHRKSKAAKLKSQMKQIGTTVAMYFVDGESNKYPKTPSLLEIESRFFNTDKTSSWMDVNTHSPYYFFCNESSTYTGRQNIPLATNWDPVKERDKEYLYIVWEDGHVSHISKEEQSKLIEKSLSGAMSSLYRTLTFKSNPAIQ